MSKFKVSDQTVTLLRVNNVSKVPVFNASMLCNSKIDPHLNSTVLPASVLYFDGEKWISSTIPSTPVAAVYGSFISITEQKPTSTTTGTPITYDQKTVGNMLVKNNTYPNSKIIIPTAGVYRVLFSAQCDSVSGNNHLLEIWPVVNGTAVPNSNTKIVLNSRSESCLTVEYFLTLAQNAELELYMVGNSVNDCRIIAYPANGTIPAVPSIILNINKI